MCVSDDEVVWIENEGEEVLFAFWFLGFLLNGVPLCGCSYATRSRVS
jgi:hypothetical protein